MALNQCPKTHSRKYITWSGCCWEPIVYFTILLAQSQTRHSWFQDPRRKHNCIHYWALWAAAECAPSRRVFPFLLASQFLYLILERISWRWNWALNMLQSHLNFNERQVLPLWHGGPCWIVATTNSFQVSTLWLELNECICESASHNKHFGNTNAHRQKCKHAYTQSHTYLKKWTISLLLTKRSTAGKTQSPCSSLFIFCGKRSLTNNTFLRCVCVLIKKKNSHSPLLHLLMNSSTDKYPDWRKIWNLL